MQKIDDIIADRVDTFIEGLRSALGNHLAFLHSVTILTLRDDMVRYSRLSALVDEEGETLESNKEGGGSYMNPNFTALLAIKKSMKIDLSVLNKVIDEKEKSEKLQREKENTERANELASEAEREREAKLNSMFGNTYSL